MGRGFRFRVGAKSVLMLLSDLTVSVCCVSSLLFLSSLNWSAGAGDMGQLGGFSVL